MLITIYGTSGNSNVLGGEELNIVFLHIFLVVIFYSTSISTQSINGNRGLFHEKDVATFYDWLTGIKTVLILIKNGVLKM